jgi:aspartyl-tRNA(Asn)/glutamyl-tRNA(Gln) amidotransferase subunit C
MPALTLEEVQEIALLARLELDAAEVERLRSDLTSILSYIGKLEALDTQGVEPMTHAVPLECPLREDRVLPSLSASEALAGAPARDDDFFEVPKIIDLHAAEEGKR